MLVTHLKSREIFYWAIELSNQYTKEIAAILKDDPYFQSIAKWPANHSLSLDIQHIAIRSFLLKMFFSLAIGAEVAYSAQYLEKLNVLDVQEEMEIAEYYEDKAPLIGWEKLVFNLKLLHTNLHTDDGNYFVAKHWYESFKFLLAKAEKLPCDLKPAKPPLQKSITITWHIEDVQSIRENLSDEQASHVLQVIKENHNAELGINWDVIECLCDDLYPQPSED